jgi:stearoyl-CoA desaturase (delta-9 desaturase)
MQYFKLNSLQVNALAVHILAIAGLVYFWDPIWLLVFLIGNRLIMGIGHDIGMHRYFAHRSFKTYTWMEYVFIFFTWFSTHGNTLEWVARHRQHHSNSDLDGDPHPSRKWFATWFWFSTEDSKYTTYKPSMVKDLLRNPMHKFMRNHYFKMYWLFLATSLVVLGPKFTLYFFILNGVAGFHTAGLINVVMHKWGYRNFETTDLSRNNWVANILYPGCGWHNNHHARPSSYTYQFKSNEWDTSAWLIKNVIATNKSELRPITADSVR